MVLERSRSIAACRRGLPLQAWHISRFFLTARCVSRMTPCYFATREDTADDIIAVLFLRARSSCLFESEGTS